MGICVKRVYDPPAPEDGRRFLVDRLWPWGIKIEALHLDGWLKKVAPSDALRRWFGHDPAKWRVQQRYFAELEAKPGIFPRFGFTLSRLSSGSGVAKERCLTSAPPNVIISPFSTLYLLS